MKISIRKRTLIKDSIVFMMFLLFMLLGPQSIALTNSEPALNEVFTSVVMLKTEDVDSAGDTVPGYCNATILSPRVLITAAHCVFRSHVANKHEIELQVGKYKYKNLPDGTVKRIGYSVFFQEHYQTQYYFTPNIKSQIQRSGLQTQIGPMEDIAILVLAAEKVLPDHLPQAQIIPQKYLKGALSQLSRYLPSSVTINFFSEPSLDIKRMAVLNRLEVNSGYFESTSNARLEEGDSGSPLFLSMAVGNSSYTKHPPIQADFDAQSAPDSNSEQKYLAGIAKGRASTIFSNWDVFGILDQKVCSIAAEDAGVLKDLLCR